jgi:cytoskeletal protein RodZ
VPGEQVTSVIQRPQGAYEPTSQAFEAPSSFTGSEFSPMPSGERPADDERRKLIIWFGAACAALLAVLVVVIIYGVFFNMSNTTHLSDPTTSATEPEPATTAPGSETETATESPTESPTAPSGSGAQGTDGGLTFAVTGVETAPSVQYQDAPVEKTAQGEFVIVHMTVLNSGAEPATFLGTYQKLNAGGITYYIDDEATFYVGGGLAELAPGDQADVALAFDVPPGTTPESIELHADPMGSGVQVPLA